jgi:glycosidase
MHFALTDVLTKPSGWDEGVGRLYRVLASDYLYATPSKQVVFLDNHDLPRIFGVVGSDLQKMRMGLVMLYTMRGIPCITYGTEAAMRETREHGTIRQDMPGGWPSDMRSIWNARQRTSEEQECFDMLRQLGQYRKQSKPLTTGRLMQFAPENGLYTYVRYTNEEAVVVVVNADSIPRTLQTKRLDDVLGGVRVSKDSLSNTNNTLQANEQIEPYGVRIWEMVRKR